MQRVGRLPVLVGLAIVAVLAVAFAGWAYVNRDLPAAPESAVSDSPAATTTSTTAAAPPTTAGAQPQCRAVDAIAAMGLRERVAQLLMVGVLTADEATAVVRDHHVGGIFLHGSDTAVLDRAVIDGITAQAPIAPFVAADEEGGRVQRIDDVHGSIPSAREMAATMTPQQVEALGLERGRQMAALGLTMDLAPVVDVSSQADDDVIGDRSYSEDPNVVVAYAGAFAEGLRQAGIYPILKHFPGHGRAAGDSHTGASVTPPLDDLRAVDLVPYEQLTGARRVGVMLGHLTVPGLTEPDTPATVSPAAVRLLRDEVGFDGLVMTDDLVGMTAITARFDLPDAVQAAIAAGVDVALWVSTERVGEVIDHLTGSVESGALSEARVNEAVRRVLVAKGIDPCAL